MCLEMGRSLQLMHFFDLTAISETPMNCDMETDGTGDAGGNGITAVARAHARTGVRTVGVAIPIVDTLGGGAIVACVGSDVHGGFQSGCGGGRGTKRHALGPSTVAWNNRAMAVRSIMSSVS